MIKRCKIYFLTSIYLSINHIPQTKTKVNFLQNSNPNKRIINGASMVNRNKVNPLKNSNK